MAPRVLVGRLSIAAPLWRFANAEALPTTGLDPADFWAGVEGMIEEFAPRIREMVAHRDRLQGEIDEFWSARDPDLREDQPAAEAFLRDIGYLVPEPGHVAISTANVDREVSSQPGPQLVVPLLNARFAANAANARWGSLYDALYGTDAVPNTDLLARGESYNPIRGQEVIARGRAFLDEFFPLESGSHAEVRRYVVGPQGLEAHTQYGRTVVLVERDQFVGYRGSPESPTALVVVHHGLHAEIQVDRAHPVGLNDLAGVCDILLESAVTAIMDLEDSVAAVDAEDKVLGYRNWLQLMTGTLKADVTKGGRSFVRSLEADRRYLSTSGTDVVLPGRALLFVRHVGHAMNSDAILDSHGNPSPEGVLDAIFTGLGSLRDVVGPATGANSRSGSVYVVKPKLHGPDEVALACEIFARTEQLLGMPPLTIKIGLMDEERRTSANLKACIAAAHDRIAFINTGFLDRTGDEIHTNMLAGPMVRKAEMKSQQWIAAYEDANVDIGLECGFMGRAQIGKGMWAAPDSMAAMLEQKIQHPLAGATCAWVPSPTAATLHAIHYHQVDVPGRQRAIADMGRRSTLGQLLTVPIGDSSAYGPGDRSDELDNNIQSTLGYVVRWINDGVGCSKVPDIHGTPLMEDRATCRISSQHVSNWVCHGVVTIDEVEESLRRMAVTVDRQNSSDPGYQPMAPGFDGHAFLAARDLVLDGVLQPSGYTEPILHRHRIATKSATSRSTA